MTEINIAALAKLARLDIGHDELAKLERELPGIMQFVDTIQKTNVSAHVEAPALRNVMRADGDPHESGKFTETLLRAAPAREGNRVVVRQVISRKK